MTKMDRIARSARWWGDANTPSECIAELLHRLQFRPERSRPVWKNRHTGETTVVTDLRVNDRGGFQGGMRQFVVVTNEPPPPGPPSVNRRDGREWSASSFLGHWEPTGKWVSFETVPELTPNVAADPIEAAAGALVARYGPDGARLKLLATVNGIAAEEERKQRIQNARHALRYRAEARGERRS